MEYNSKNKIVFCVDCDHYRHYCLDVQPHQCSNQEIIDPITGHISFGECGNLNDGHCANFTLKNNSSMLSSRKGHACILMGLSLAIIVAMIIFKVWCLA